MCERMRESGDDSFLSTYMRKYLLRGVEIGSIRGIYEALTISRATRATEAQFRLKTQKRVVAAPSHAAVTIGGTNRRTANPWNSFRKCVVCMSFSEAR